MKLIEYYIQLNPEINDSKLIKENTPDCDYWEIQYAKFGKTKITLALL